MKKKLFAGMLCLGILTVTAGCSSRIETGARPEETMETTGTTTAVETTALPEESQAEPPEQRDYYGELIEAARKCSVEKDAEMLENYDFSSVIRMSGIDDETLGYQIKDLDGNGTGELIFGGNRAEPGHAWDGIIYDIYTIADGELIHVLDGWERNRYYLCENGMIANEGSSSAFNSNYSYFTFEGEELELVESVIYDEMKDAGHPWFYSTESEYDAEYADPISEEWANEIIGSYRYQRPVFTPFGQTEAAAQASTPDVSLSDVMDRILASQGLENALEYDQGMEDLRNDTIVKLCTSESGQFTAYGFISPEFGKCGILLNNILDGQDNWNYLEEPWSYSSDRPTLTEQGKYEVLFTFPQKNGAEEGTRELYFDTYDTGTMSLRDTTAG